MCRVSRFWKDSVKIVLKVLVIFPFAAVGSAEVAAYPDNVVEYKYQPLNAQKDEQVKDRYKCFKGEAKKVCTQRPKTKNKKPVKVQLSLHLLDILEVNEKDGTWTVRAFLYSRWRDRERLKFEPSDFDGLNRLSYSGILAEEQVKRIWTPDLTITNSFNRRIQEKLELTINRNGTVVHKEIFTAKIRTKFDYSMFPFDKQVAAIEIEPFTEIIKSVRLVPAVRKSGNSSKSPDTWASGEFTTEFTTRPGARYELTTDEPGAWLSPNGANNFSLVTYRLELERNYFNFLTTKILILFVFGLALWVSAMTFSKERLSADWPWEVVLGIIFFSLDGQDMLPTLSYLTLFNVLVITIYVYAAIDLAVWTIGRTRKTLDDFNIQVLLQRLRVFVIAPAFIIIWWATIFHFEQISNLING